MSQSCLICCEFPDSDADEAAIARNGLCIRCQALINEKPKGSSFDYLKTK